MPEPVRALELSFSAPPAVEASVFVTSIRGFSFSFSSRASIERGVASLLLSEESDESVSLPVAVPPVVEPDMLMGTVPVGIDRRFESDAVALVWLEEVEETPEERTVSRREIKESEREKERMRMNKEREAEKGRRGRKKERERDRSEGIERERLTAAV
jgi:hypothetical protein